MHGLVVKPTQRNDSSLLADSKVGRATRCRLGRLDVHHVFGIMLAALAHRAHVVLALSKQLLDQKR